MVQRPSSRYRPSVAERVQRRAFAALLALPQSVRKRAAGQPHVVDGGALDSDIAVGLRALGRARSEGTRARNIDDARRSLDAESWMFAGQPADVGSVHQVMIDGRSHGGECDIPAVLYRPKPNPVTVAGKHAEAARPSDKALPCVVYFHGGGWMLGSAQSHDAVARALCADGDVVVLNVDYRLAPEHVFPAAVEDAVAAFRWAHAHAEELGIDPNRIAVAGDSAGGNLAAVVAQVTTRDGGAKPALQMLFVPATDMTLPRSDSYEKFSSGYLLTRESMDWYEANYLGGGDTPPANIDQLRADPLASPLLAPDLPALAAAGMPPAYVAVAGFDPLRDEGIAYARRLERAGVPTTLRVHADAVHPFMSILATDLGQRCMADAVGALRMALHVDGA